MHTYRLWVATAFTALIPTQTARASFYPPDYVIGEHCQTQGSVEVCAVNRTYGHYPRLRIQYRGALMEHSWGHISVYVQLNGKEQVFPMKNLNYQESISIGGPTAVRICKAGVPTTDESELPPYSRTCLHTLEPAGSIVWEADPVPENEQDLFFYSSNGPVPNAWDVAVAFVSENGEWDSQLGANYRFRFD